MGATSSSIALPAMRAAPTVGGMRKSLPGRRPREAERARSRSSGARAPRWHVGAVDERDAAEDVVHQQFVDAAKLPTSISYGITISNRVFKSYDDLVDHCCEALKYKLVFQPWRIMSIGLRQWAHEF